jgi:hypothetical protein
MRTGRRIGTGLAEGRSRVRTAVAKPVEARKIAIRTEETVEGIRCRTVHLCSCLKPLDQPFRVFLTLLGNRLQKFFVRRNFSHLVFSCIESGLYRFTLPFLLFFLV